LTLGGAIKPVVIDSFWYRRINEAIAFMALSVFALYMWFAFLSPSQPSYEIQLTTLFVAVATAASSIVARAIVDMKGTFVRTLISYLLLAATVALLLYDTSGISSPYLFMWTLVAAFAVAYPNLHYDANQIEGNRFEGLEKILFAPRIFIFA
jgi:FtsH-binding integral membrane protein